MVEGNKIVKIAKHIQATEGAQVIDANGKCYVHAYTPVAIQTSLRAGVKSIEHGQLMDEETEKMIT